MTQHSIAAAVAKLFPEPAHTVLSEVRNGTGFVRGPLTSRRPEGQRHNKLALKKKPINQKEQA